MKERYQERKQMVLIISLFAVLLVCAGTYFVFKAKRDHNKALSKQIALKDNFATQSATALATAISTAVSTSVHTASVTATATSTNTSTKSSTSTKTNTKTSTKTSTSTETSTKTKTKTATSTSSNTSTETVTDNTPKKYNLTLKANEDAWIRFQMDDGAIKNMILPNGHTAVLRANRVIKIFSSKLGKLQALLNGEEVKDLVQPGRAMSAVLPASEVAHYPLPLFPMPPSTNNATNQNKENSQSSSNNSSNDAN